MPRPARCHVRHGNPPADCAPARLYRRRGPAIGCGIHRTSIHSRRAWPPGRRRYPRHHSMNPAFFLKWKQAPSVRTSLVLLVIACILPVASVSAILIAGFYRKQQAQLISNAVSRARTVIAAVDHDFGSTEVALRTLGTARVLMAGDLRAFHARAVDVLGNLHAD